MENKIDYTYYDGQEGTAIVFFKNNAKPIEEMVIKFGGMFEYKNLDAIIEEKR